MAFRILRFEDQPIGPPRPLYADDSESFPPGVVREVRTWLDATQYGFDARTPTAIIVSLTRPGPDVLAKNADESLERIRIEQRYTTPEHRVPEGFRFTHGTFTARLIDRHTKQVQAVWTLFAAKCVDGRIIVGPILAGDWQSRPAPLIVHAGTHAIDVSGQRVEVELKEPGNPGRAGIVTGEVFGRGGVVSHADDGKP